MVAGKTAVAITKQVAGVVAAKRNRRVKLGMLQNVATRLARDLQREQLSPMTFSASPFHAVPVFPRGFRCASRNVGLKPSARDLTLFASDVDATAAAVFTRNHFPGAPVILGRETIRGGVLRAIIANSKVSNVATGRRGVENARRMAAAAAAELGTTANHVLVSSTGVIGVPLPIEKIEAGVVGMATELQGDPMIGAEGIMTTDAM